MEILKYVIALLVTISCSNYQNGFSFIDNSKELEFDFNLNEELEVYITPRNVTYGWADNGIYQFDLNKKSFKVKYEERSYRYESKIIKDSVYELFYCRINIKNDILTKINKTPLIPDIKRIMIITESNDTLYIDRNYNLIKGDCCFSIPEELKYNIEKVMPVELKESWTKDLPRW